MDAELTRSLDLMKQAQEGDRDALDRLVARYYERVRPIVRARMGRQLRSRVDSGDILQQTFEAVVRTYDRFEVEDEANLISWMATIAERQIRGEVDKQKADKRRPDREVPLQTETASGRVVGPAVATHETPDEALELEEQTRLMEDCLAELDELQRELILLRDYAGHSWEEVARRTDRPSPEAARMMHSKARIELGKQMRRNSGP